MIVKTFTGATVREALDKVRESFGPDAVILDTKCDRSSGNRMKGSSVHVTAAHETAQFEPPELEGAKTLHVAASLRDAQDDLPVEPDPPPASTAPATEPDPPPAAAVAAPPVVDGESLTGVVQALRAQLRERRIDSGQPGIWPDLRRWLVTQPALVQELIDAYAAHVSESVPPPQAFVAESGKGRTILFIGAHGVGKSTALFKLLAARWQMRVVKPRLLVLSGSEEHGQERLLAWSERCDIAAQAYAIKAAPRLRSLRRSKDEDLFVEYIPATDPQSDAGSAERLLRALKPDIVVQVYSAAGSQEAWRDQTRRLSVFNPAHFVITHWDAHPCWWHTAQLAAESRLSPAYRVFGTGPVAEYEAFTITALRTGISERLLREIGVGRQASEERKVLS